MITGDINKDNVLWLLHELKQIEQDRETVINYYNFVLRGNTVSVRYHAIDEESEMSWNMPLYIEKQIAILDNARNNILKELEKTKLEKMYTV
jgi:dTDP-4-amino-4,6-dideoxygalactose transaminase